MELGPLSVEAGGMYHRIAGRWIPDGLHIWWGNRGVHLHWKFSPHSPRVEFDRVP